MEKKHPRNDVSGKRRADGMNISISSSDTDINVSDNRHLIYGGRNGGRSAIAVCALQPSELISPAEYSERSEDGVQDENLDEDVSTDSTITSASGLRLRMARQDGKMNKHNEIPLNDFNSESSFQSPPEVESFTPRKRIRFKTGDAEVFYPPPPAVGFKFKSHANQSTKRRAFLNKDSKGSKSRFDMMKRNRMSISFMGKGTLLESDRGNGQVNDGRDGSDVDVHDDGVDGHIDSAIIDDGMLPVKKPKPCKDRFLKNVKSKIQKTTKNNRLNRVYSPVLIVNLIDVS